MEACKKCGADLPESALFCPVCGKKQVQERKYRKRANGTGCISKLSGNRSKPWIARKNGISVGTFATRHEAQKALERLTDVTVNDKFNMTFKEVYERWFAEHSREVNPKMVANYKSSFKQCAQLHDVPIRKILRSDYQAAVIALEVKGMSKSTCEKLCALFSMVGRYATNEEITVKNAAEGLTTVARQKSSGEIFTAEEIAAIKKAKHPAADIALILLSCGCRPGELFTVPLVNCREDYFIGGSKTDAGKNRVLPINPDGIEAYTRIRNAAIAKGADLFIEGYSGKNKTASNFTKRDWKELMAETGITGKVPYDFRHTFITRAILSGVDLPVLEAIVGHVDRETTKIYTHLRAGDLVDAVQVMKGEKAAVCSKSVTRKKPV